MSTMPTPATASPLASTSPGADDPGQGRGEQRRDQAARGERQQVDAGLER